MSDTVGIGVDLCRIDRIEKAIQKDHFNRRVYTEQEIAYFSGKGRQAAPGGGEGRAVADLVVEGGIGRADVAGYIFLLDGIDKLDIYIDALHIEAQLECEADFERGFRLGSELMLNILDIERL